MNSFAGLRVGLIGPLPPPSGGMANQTKQLHRLLRSEGAKVELVQVNRPYYPVWIGSVRWLRALARTGPYLVRLQQAARRVDLFHIMANSGWSWHFFAAPATWVAHANGIPSVVNYRGGNAEPFFDRSFRFVKPTLRLASEIVVPSPYLEATFVRRGFHASVVPNVVDLERFAPVPARPGGRQWKHDRPEILVARNLEPLYDIQTALQAFRIVHQAIPGARLKIAGSGPEQPKLMELTSELGLGDAVSFLGRIDNEEMPSLYRSADVVVNPSLVDNMPISLLEALASGVAVVSTDVGGIPLMVENRKTALLVPPRRPDALADSVLDLLKDGDLRARLEKQGLALVQQYGWSRVRDRWARIYRQALERRRTQPSVKVDVDRTRA